MAQRRQYTCLVALVVSSILCGFAPHAQAQTWNVVWTANFSGPAGSYPSGGDWNWDVGGGGWGNAELEYYCAPGSNTAPCSTSRPNIYLDGNNNLVIRASNNGGTWTSGRMNTASKHAIQYGRFEANISLPSGAGIWPAFWMLGSNIGSVGWPACGEIDIMESVPSLGNQRTQASLHGANGYNTGNQVTLSSPINNFHLYGVNWWQQNIQFYVDDYTRPYASLTPSSSGGTWEFDNGTQFMILNLAIGGNWPGPPNSGTPNPAYMLVNNLRVLQYSSSGGGGGGGTTTPGTIVNKNSGKCVDAAAAATANGTHVQQYTCNGTNAQVWSRIATDSGYVRIGNANNTNQVIDINGPSTADGALAQLWAYGGGTNQQWLAVSEGSGYYHLVVRNSGKCLDVPSASTADGVQLQQWTCNGTAAQSFKLN